MQTRTSMIQGVVRNAAWVATIVICAIAAISLTKKETDMNPKTVQQEGFAAVGIAAIGVR